MNYYIEGFFAFYDLVRSFLSFPKPWNCWILVFMKTFSTYSYASIPCTYHYKMKCDVYFNKEGLLTNARNATWMNCYRFWIHAFLFKKSHDHCMSTMLSSYPRMKHIIKWSKLFYLPISCNPQFFGFIFMNTNPKL